MPFEIRDLNDNSEYVAKLHFAFVFIFLKCTWF